MSDLADQPAETYPVPAPARDLSPSLTVAAHALETSYFDPEKWDTEVAQWRRTDDRDPVANNLGRCQSRAAAALFVSDFHMADGTAGGDDFLESHLQLDEELGFYTGFSPPGRSRADQFLSVLTFARERVAEKTSNANMDVVLNGDIINAIEMTGRGGSVVSSKHCAVFRGLAVMKAVSDVYYLRGNHDYAIPSGPWATGEFYVNEHLKVLAEHGDFWDKENWPPGPDNKGSRLVIEAGSAFEVHPGVMRNGELKYLMSGIDNLRPWNNDAAEGFLDRRAKYSKAAWLTAAMARLKYVGAADDSAAFAGAKQRRQGEYRDWLMVQGHTHVPAAVPDVYYNSGTWISTLVAIKGREQLIDAFPFLLVYRTADGRRNEEYFMVRSPALDASPRIELHTPQSVNALRCLLGYEAIQ